MTGIALAIVFGNASPMKYTKKDIEIELIKLTAKLSIAPLNRFKKTIVDMDEIAIATELVPINMVVNERSNLFKILNSSFAVLLPSSALI